MTAIESGSKELGRLLALIGARKDQAAFAALYSATKGKLFSTVLLIVKRSDIAEEIIQETYVRIWHSASSYRPSRGSPMTWMITIARNLAIDMVRKPVREIYSDNSELLELPADGPTALEIIEASEDKQTAMQEQHDVFSALQALDPTRRDLIIAAYIHGESREQLSKRTGIPVNTIKTWIRRSLLELESMLLSRKKERKLDILASFALDDVSGAGRIEVPLLSRQDCSPVSSFGPGRVRATRSSHRPILEPNRPSSVCGSIHE